MDTISIADNQIAWTTTRCNRLLRPIASRLAVLRKDTLDRKSIVPKDRNKELDHQPKPAIRAGKRVNISQASKDVRPRGFDKMQDPDWMPQPRPIGITKRLYKGKKTEGKSDPIPRFGAVGRPGDVYLPTPYIARSLGKMQDSPQIQASPLQFTGRSKAKLIKPKEHLQAMKKQMVPDMWKQIDGLYDGFSNLLQATKSHTDKSRGGSRSLLSTCLRQIPAYIRLEEYFVEEDGEDEDKDVANGIYTYLEDHGAAKEGIGWKSLKEVVRAHAVSLLREAIEDRILVPSVILGLYRLCMNASAWNEAEEFLSSYVISQDRMAPPKELRVDLFGSDQSPCWSLISEFVTRTGRHQFLYEQLQLVLSRDLLPTEWLATQGMLPVWSRVVRTVAEGDHRAYANAVGLLESAVAAGMGLKDELLHNIDFLTASDDQYSWNRVLPKPDIRDALSNTFSSLFTLLSSIVSVSNQRSETIDKRTVRSVTWALLGITTSIIDRVNIDTRHATEGDDSHAQRALYAISAPFLLQIDGITLESTFIHINTDQHVQILDQICTAISRSVSNSAINPETLPNLVCSLARCFGRASHDDGFDHLEKLVQYLVDPPQQISTQSQWFTKRVALAASIEFAQSTKDRTHVAFARQIERTVQDSGPMILEQTPRKRNTSASPMERKGFRWEEGVCEWIACTPFTKPQAQPATRMPPQSSIFPPTPTDSESEPDLSMSYRHTNVINIPSDAQAVQSYSSPSLRLSHVNSPIRPVISNCSSGSSKRAHSPSLPASKRRRTDSFGYTGPAPTKSFAVLVPRTKCVTPGSRRMNSHSSTYRKRRSLGEIVDIVSKLKSGRLRSKPSSDMDTSAESGGHRQRISSAENNLRKNGYACGSSTSSVDPQSSRRNRLANNAFRSQHPQRRSTSDVASSDMVESDEDELSFTATQIHQVRQEMRRAAPGARLRRTVSSRSAPRGRDSWVGKGVGWDDSEDELNFG